MRKIIILRGLPASGKSTWAKEQVLKENNWIIVNRDKIREMLKGIYSNFPFGTDMENLVTSIEDKSIYKAVELGYDVIVDATNFRGNRWIKYKKDVQFTYKEFDTSLKECIMRDSLREFPIGKEIIIKMYNKYIKNDR